MGKSNILQNLSWPFVYFEARARLNNQLESQTIAALHARLK